MANHACVDPGTLSYRFSGTATCKKCRAKRREDGCLFISSYTPIEPRTNNKDPDLVDKLRARKKAHNRRKGLTENGRPLPRTCWNCDEICSDGIRYFCSRGLIEPMTQRQAYQARQARECEYFQLRLTEGIESA